VLSRLHQAAATATAAAVPSPAGFRSPSYCVAMSHMRPGAAPGTHQQTAGVVRGGTVHGGQAPGPAAGQTALPYAVGFALSPGDMMRQPPLAGFQGIIIFHVSRRQREMYCGHVRLCVCLCVCMSVCSRPHAYTIARTNYRLFVPKTFSFPRTKGPYGELSFPRNEISRNFRSRDLSFPGTFVLGEQKFPGTVVPGPFYSRELSFPENESFWELSFLGPFVPGNFRFHYPIGQSPLEVGLMISSVSLSTGIITFIHFAFLFNRKKATRTHLKLTQFIFGKQTLQAYYETNSDSCYSCLRS